MTQTIPCFITVDELPKYMQNNNTVLLDMRDSQSFEDQHLPNAISIRPEQLPERVKELDKDKLYIVICYHGVMAVSVAHFMQDHGLKASVLKGGMAAVH